MTDRLVREWSTSRRGEPSRQRPRGTRAYAELLVAGGPSPDRLDDDPDVQRLRAVADRHGVGRRVTFLGAVLRPDVPALLRSADVMVTVPWYEPFGITPLEAMACGTPVVASAVGGLTDSVVHGTTGLLVPPRQPAALADALGPLLTDETRLRGLGRAAAEWARSRYGWDRVADETSRIYRRVIEDRRGAFPLAVAR